MTKQKSLTIPERNWASISQTQEEKAEAQRVYLQDLCKTTSRLLPVTGWTRGLYTAEADKRTLCHLVRKAIKTPEHAQKRSFACIPWNKQLTSRPMTFCLNLNSILSPALWFGESSFELACLIRPPLPARGAFVNYQTNLLRSRYTSMIFSSLAFTQNAWNCLPDWFVHQGSDEPPSNWDGDDNILSPRQLLRQYWSRWACWYKYQPLDHIKDYFGIHIAIYFGWLGETLLLKYRFGLKLVNVSLVPFGDPFCACFPVCYRKLHTSVHSTIVSWTDAPACYGHWHQSSWITQRLSW